MRVNSLSLRLAAAAVLWSVVLLLAGAALLALLFNAYVERNFDARLEAYIEQLAAAVEIEDGVVTARPLLNNPGFDQPFSGWYWQIGDAARPLARSPSLWDQVLAVPALAPGGVAKTGVSSGPSGQALRYMARAIRPPGAAQPLAFIVAVDAKELRRENQRFNAALTWSLGVLGPWMGGLIVAGFVLFVLFQQRFGLRPLRRLGRALNDVRLGRAARLAGRYPVEIDPLARELNALLDENEAVVGRARAHVGDLAHALKTPLAVLANEAEGAEGPLAATVRRTTADMRRLVERQLARARMSGGARVLGARARVAPVVRELGRTLATIHRERGLAFHADCDEALCFRGEHEDLQEIIGNLLDNAFKWARGEVWIKARAEGEGRIAIVIDDDGPGLPQAYAEAAMTRGTRLDETTPGSGLGLAIVRDLVTLYGGALSLERAPLGGVRARLSLPRAAS